MLPTLWRAANWANNFNHGLGEHQQKGGKHVAFEDVQVMHKSVLYMFKDIDDVYCVKHMCIIQSISLLILIHANAIMICNSHSLISYK